MMIFFKAFLLGLAYCMPIGSQNIYLIRYATKNGLPVSYNIAAIIILFDISIGISCFFGVGSLLKALPHVTAFVAIGGALYLALYGLKLLRKKASDTEGSGIQGKPLNIWGAVGVAAMLTWGNPQALIDGSLILSGY